MAGTKPHGPRPFALQVSRIGVPLTGGAPRLAPGARVGVPPKDFGWIAQLSVENPALNQPKEQGTLRSPPPSLVKKHCRDSVLQILSVLACSGWGSPLEYKEYFSPTLPWHRTGAGF